MKLPILIQSKTSLPVDEIIVQGRLRPAGDAGVAAIVESINETGQITSPIIVRQVRRQTQLGSAIRYEIIDGAHRLAAAKELGWEEVPVRVYECSDDQAAIMEIDGNLAGAELNALDQAVFMATRKAVYERLHPETKAGVAGGLRKNYATELSSVASFVNVTAEKFGISERQVRKIVAAGSRLHPDEIHQLRAAPRPVSLKDLQNIGKIHSSVERHAVVRLLAEGKAKSAAAARKALKAPSDAPIKDPVEDQFLALRTAWARAGAPARRRFVDECGIDLTRLLGLQLGVEMPAREAAE